VDERAALVLRLGELGAAPREFLADPWLVVRGCAALAPALAEDAAAHAVLVRIAESPRAFDAGFARVPPAFAGAPRCAVIEAACARVADAEALVDAVDALDVRRPWGSGGDIAPFVERLFAGGWPASPTARGRSGRWPSASGRPRRGGAARTPGTAWPSSRV